MIIDRDTFFFTVSSACQVWKTQNGRFYFVGYFHKEISMIRGIDVWLAWLGGYAGEGLHNVINNYGQNRGLDDMYRKVSMSYLPVSSDLPVKM